MPIADRYGEFIYHNFQDNLPKFRKFYAKADNGRS